MSFIVLLARIILCVGIRVKRSVLTVSSWSVFHTGDLRGVNETLSVSSSMRGESFPPCHMIPGSLMLLSSLDASLDDGEPDILLTAFVLD